MNNYSEIKNQFIELYYKEAEPILVKFEKERIFKNRLADIVRILIVLIGLPLIFIHFYINEDYTIKYFMIGFCVLIAGGVILELFISSFQNKIKENIMPIICKCFGNFIWKQGNDHDEKTYSAIGLIPKFDFSYYDDSFYGEYNGVEIEIQEPYFKRSFGKHSVTVFDGIIVKLKMNKNFFGLTTICSNSIFNLSPSRYLKRTILEDKYFESKFNVYTNDEVEARYLITPYFMEKLNCIKKAFNTSVYSCAFYQKYFYIALNNSKDLFSIGSLYSPLNDIKCYSKTCDEIISIISLVDYFKLNSNSCFFI